MALPDNWKVPEKLLQIPDIKSLAYWMVLVDFWLVSWTDSISALKRKPCAGLQTYK